MRVLTRTSRARRVLGVACLVAAASALGVGAGGTGATSAAAPHRPATADAKPSGALIRIGSGAAFQGYATPKVTMAKGGTLRVANRDSMVHSVTSVGRASNGKPLFDTVVDAGGTARVAGASSLAPGVYPFFCRFHPNMRGTLTVTGHGGGHQPTTVKFQQPLAIPRVITSAHPHLEVHREPVRVLPHGPKTMMWTYGGSYPAPTIVRPAGHDTKVTFTDDLPRSVGPISVHLHGDHHASADDGQPTTYSIGRGSSRTYDYPLANAGHPTRSTLDFYHDHRMMVTGRNNWYGMQGMFEITSPAQSRLQLPSGRYDVPLMFADRSFDKHNQLQDPFTHKRPPPDDGVTGEQVLVDGRFAPYLNVTTHRYRLRLLNTSNFTAYDFELGDGRSFEQIGNGDGLFAHPVKRHDILLGPFQSADVVVDFRGELGRQVVLRSVPRVSNPDHGTGSPAASLMQFRVTQKARDTSQVPQRLEKPERYPTAPPVSFHWVLGRTGSGSASTWTINGDPFDPARLNVMVPLGDTRTWEITNSMDMTHYVHLHEEEWHTISRDGHRPPPWERGLEDTWRLDPGESIVVSARFTDFTGAFMIHCHMLDHEDDGMMAQFAVLAPGQTTTPPGYYLDPGNQTPTSGSGTSMGGM